MFRLPLSSAAYDRDRYTITVIEVHDFLQERYGQRIAVDLRDTRSEKDLRDLMQASLAHAKRTIWTGEEEYG